MFCPRPGCPFDNHIKTDVHYCPFGRCLYIEEQRQKMLGEIVHLGSLHGPTQRQKQRLQRLKAEYRRLFGGGP